MGLFDLFTGGKGSSSSISRTANKANNKHAQSVDRMAALESLRENGSAEAIGGLLRRFSFVYDKTIEDEQEKQWVHDTLAEMAKADLPIVLAALQHNMLTAESIAWQLKVLRHIASDEQAWPVIAKVIEANDNEYVRDPSKKVQLITFLGEEVGDPRCAPALVQYLEDMDEGVRFNTVEALFHQKNEEVAREPLLKLLTKEGEDSRRIKIRILDGLADIGWNTHGYKGQVEKICQELDRGHSIDGKGRVKKPSQK